MPKERNCPGRVFQIKQKKAFYKIEDIKAGVL